jgi:hypothetical protein
MHSKSGKGGRRSASIYGWWATTGNLFLMTVRLRGISSSRAGLRPTGTPGAAPLAVWSRS